MNIIELNVPDYVEHLSDWKEYSIPQGHCIIDKSVTGCGFTESCLRSNDNIILCSPRRLLLESKVNDWKEDEEKDERRILYLENIVDKIESRFDKDLSEEDGNELITPYGILFQISQEDKKAADLYKKSVLRFKGLIQDHLALCKSYGLPVKFLVTYDSSHYAIDILEEMGILGQFKVIVDEFQQIWGDASLKPTIELDFVHFLQKCPNVCYVSATPMIESYLSEIPEFASLDFYRMNWTDRFVSNVPIIIEETDNAYNSMKGVIKKYLDGEFPKIVDNNGNIVESKEAVIYLNSVNGIIDLVKSCKLTPDNTTIVCSPSKENEKKLKKVGFTVGSPNTKFKMDQNTMFTFCTRTVYLGTDFFSTCASSYVVCNPDIKYLSIDIAMDLPQIMGRQRLDINPFKNYCVLFYQNSLNFGTKEELEACINKKLAKTDVGLRLFYKDSTDDQEKNYMISSRCFDYKLDYLCYSRKTLKLELNRLVLASERRFWEVKESFRNGVKIRKALTDQGISFVESGKSDSEKWIDTKINEIHASNIFSEKLQIYCETADVLSNNQKDRTYFRLRARDPRNLLEYYYDLLGSKILKSKKYRKNEIDAYIDFVASQSRTIIKNFILSEFKPGNFYSLKEIKTKLDNLFQQSGISGIKPAASLIEGVLNVKKVKKVNKDTQVSENGYKILSIKP